jgi:hypothetical protein
MKDGGWGGGGNWKFLYKALVPRVSVVIKNFVFAFLAKEFD